MNAVAVQEVRPTGARFEALAIAVAAVLVATGLALWIHQHGRTETTRSLYDWQVSAFDALAGPDQAIYNALEAAQYDIIYLYDDLNLMNAPGQPFRWPSIQDLQESLVPPFVQDGSWQQTGSLQWSLHEPLGEGEMQGSVMYLGTGGTVAGQGSFLLVIGHVHAGFTNNNAVVIWWNAKNQVAMPQNGVRDSLILQGWREVVPHSGAAEIRRLFGEEEPGAVDNEEKSREIADELFGN
jgi:hypothetical protein